MGHVSGVGSVRTQERPAPASSSSSPAFRSLVPHTHPLPLSLSSVPSGTRTDALRESAASASAKAAENSSLTTSTHAAGHSGAVQLLAVGSHEQTSPLLVPLSKEEELFNKLQAELEAHLHSFESTEQQSKKEGHLEKRQQVRRRGDSNPWQHDRDGSSAEASPLKPSTPLYEPLPGPGTGTLLL